MDEKKFILELIGVYRGLPALWKLNSKAYSNRDEKNAQYEILLQKYKEKYPNAEKKDVAQKINILRTSYRKELRRIERIEKSDSGVKEDCDSNLYYFDAMDFLRDNEKPCASQTSTMDENETVTCEKKRKKPDAAEELMILAAKRLNQAPDECDKVAEGWSFKLKKMNATQRAYAEKFINEILFEGQMGTLHRNAMQLNILTSSSPAYSSGYSSSQTTDFFHYSDGSLNPSSTPVTKVSDPLASPQINPVINYTLQAETLENSLTPVSRVKVPHVSLQINPVINYNLQGETSENLLAR